MTTRRTTSIRLFLFAFFVTSAYMLTRIVGDSLLLARVGSQALPVMLTISAVVVGLISFFWAARTSRLAINRLLFITQSAAIAITLTLSILLRLFPESSLLICGIYVLAELRGCFNMILISTLLTEHFSHKGDKGVFAFVNAGSPVAGIIAGLLIGVNASSVSAEFLLGFSCILDIFAILAASFSKSPRSQAVEFASPEMPTVATSKIIDAVRLNTELKLVTRALVILVIAKTCVLAIVGYEWKVMADRLLSHDEKALETYFGWFYAASDALILFGQLFCTRFLLNRLGIAKCLLLLPISLLVAGIASLCTADTWLLFLTLTIARGLQVVRRAVHDVALQVVYGALPQKVRRSVVAGALGIAKPFAEASTATGIMLLTFMIPPRTLAWFWIPLLMIWLYWAVKVGKSWKVIQQKPRIPVSTKTQT